MPQLRLFMITLQPSWISNVVVVVASLIILGQANWSYATYNPEWYELFYGQFGITTAFEGAPTILQGWQESVLMSPIIYGIGVLFAALVTALLVFLIARLLVRGWQTLRTPLQHEWYDLRQRLVIRGVVLGVWIIYTLLTISIIVPFCILLSRIGAEQLTTPEGIAENLLAIGLLTITLHGHVVLIRLLCLRVRLFGNQRVTTEAFLHKRN